jgi:short-subunit dehydrogenase involved in D-alanine esterification of teichoic acids
VNRAEFLSLDLAPYSEPCQPESSEVTAPVANKVGIVTGGGTGIGRATALAKAGAVLVTGNRKARRGEEVVRAIDQAGGREVFQVTDVSKPKDATAFGLNGYPGWSRYWATNHAVTGMRKSAELAYAKREILRHWKCHERVKLHRGF